MTVYRVRVEGVEDRHSSRDIAFDETWEFDAEHPSEAVERVLHEIEWGIVDVALGRSVTITVEEVVAS